MESNREGKKVLSVVVTAYNVEMYVEECIRSILESLYYDIEILIIDDGSTDSTSNICDKFAQIDSRVRVIHKKNGGLVAARKTGIAFSRGEYITFVDGDDTVSADYFELSMRMIHNYDVDIVCNGITINDGSNRAVKQGIEDGLYEVYKLEKTLISSMNCVLGKWEAGILPSVCTKVFRKSIFEPFYNRIPNEIIIGEDAAFSYPFLLNSDKVFVQNTNCGYHYRKLTSSMSRVLNKSVAEGIWSLYCFLKDIYGNSKYNVNQQLELYRIMLVYIFVAHIQRANNYSELKNSVCRTKQALHRHSALFTISNVEKVYIPIEVLSHMKWINEEKWCLFIAEWYVRKIKGLSREKWALIKMKVKR